MKICEFNKLQTSYASYTSLKMATIDGRNRNPNGFLNPAHVTDRLSRNVGKRLPLLAA
jgi:hypothetical protein